MIGRRVLKLNGRDLTRAAAQLSLEKVIRHTSTGEALEFEFEPPIPDAAEEVEEIPEEAAEIDQEEQLRSSFRHAIDAGSSEADSPPNSLTELTDDTPLKRLCWTGVPGTMRPECWRLLVGFSPGDVAKYESLQKAYHASAVGLDVRLQKQVDVDVFRMQPGCLLFRTDAVRGICTRVLYIWGRRHPASGYVQGMDAVLSPFVVAYLAEYFRADLLAVPTLEACNSMLESLSEAQLLDVEAACYNSLAFLLSHVQDYYAPWQPGVFATAKRTRRLIRHADRALYNHMVTQGVDFLTFICRWATCLLVRELPLPIAMRLYDAYLAMGSDCADFHVYMCGVFLLHHRDVLIKSDFSEMMVLLGSAGLPTKALDEDAIGMLLSKAYVLQQQFAHVIQKRADSLDTMATTTSFQQVC